MKLYSKLLSIGLLLSGLSMFASQASLKVTRTLAQVRKYAQDSRNQDDSHWEGHTSCELRLPDLEFDDIKVGIFDPKRITMRDMQDTYQTGSYDLVKDMLDPNQKSVKHAGSSRDCFRILLTVQCLQNFDIYFWGRSDVQV